MASDHLRRVDGATRKTIRLDRPAEVDGLQIPLFQITPQLGFPISLRIAWNFSSSPSIYEGLARNRSARKVKQTVLTMVLFLESENPKSVAPSLHTFNRRLVCKFLITDPAYRYVVTVGSEVFLSVVCPSGPFLTIFIS
jgi:hypothetical protein